jgi:hypothetical protein
LPETKEGNDTLSTTTDGLLDTISWHAMTYDFKHWNLLTYLLHGAESFLRS